MNGKDKEFFEALMNKQNELIDTKLELVLEKADNTANQITGRHAVLIDSVSKNTDDINVLKKDNKILKKETGFFRWIYRNPFKFVGLSIVFILFVTSLFNLQDVIDMLKNLPKMLIR